jgi:hypothetical protein
MIAFRHITLSIALITAACGPTQDPPPTKKAREPVARPLRLSGQWRVTAFGDQPIDANQTPIYLTVNSDKIFANSQCVWWHWSHRINGNAFAARIAPRLIKHENGEMMSPPMCARGLAQHEARFAQTVEGADKITAISPTTTVLNGKAGAITLERRPGIEGSWNVMALNGRPLDSTDYPITIAIDNREIVAVSQCVSFKWTYQRDGQRLTTNQTNLDYPMCERSRRPVETKLEEIMGKLTFWRRLTDDGLYFQTGKQTVTLQPQT